MTNRKTLSRRSVLRGLGAAAASLPFLKSFPASGQVALPKLLIFAAPSGWLVGPEGGSGYEGWLPSSLHGGSEYREVAAPDTFPRILRPLEAYRDDLLVLSGLNGVNTVGTHQQAVSMLTGTGVFNNEPARSAGGDGDFTGDGQSIDHFIAERIDSRVLGMAYNIDGFQIGEGRISFLGPDRPFTPMQTAVDAFERVNGASMPTDPAVLARAARQRSVLDRLTGQLGRMRASVPSADRQRLDDHLDSVRALEADIMAPVSGCDSSRCMSGSYDTRDSANMPRLISDYGCTMSQAFACGYTRVGFIQLGNMEGGHRPAWPELGIESSYRDHAIAHKFAGQGGAGSDGLAQADAIDQGVRMQIAYNIMFASVLDRLRDTTDVDGSSVLDNTLVVHVRPMGRNHDRNNLMWMVAGGRNLGVRGGRFVRLPTGGSAHYQNDLHVTIAHMMGLDDVTEFGRGSLNRTPISLG